MRVSNIKSSGTKYTAIRIAALFAVLLSLLLAPLRGMGKTDCPAPEKAAAAACGGCCEAMECCVSAPDHPSPPPVKVPMSSLQAGSELSVALAASSRPLISLLPAGLHDYVPFGEAPLGPSPDSLALLCVRLI